MTFDWQPLPRKVKGGVAEAAGEREGAPKERAAVGGKRATRYPVHDPLELFRQFKYRHGHGFI